MFALKVTDCAARFRSRDAIGRTYVVAEFSEQTLDLFDIRGVTETRLKYGFEFKRRSCGGISRFCGANTRLASARCVGLRAIALPTKIRRLPRVDLRKQSLSGRLILVSGFR